HHLARQREDRRLDGHHGEDAGVAPLEREAEPELEQRVEHQAIGAATTDGATVSAQAKSSPSCLGRASATLGACSSAIQAFSLAARASSARFSSMVSMAAMS